MKKYEAYGYTFAIYKVADNSRRVHVEVWKDNQLYDDGYALTKDVKKAFGYDIKSDRVEYLTNPISGYQNRIRVL